MPSDYIGRNRSDAIYRFIFGVIIVSTAFVIPGIFIVVGVAAAVIYHVVDLLLQFVFNSDGVSDGGLWAVLRDLWRWPIEMLEWLFFGRSAGFPWLPRSV